MQLYLLLPLCLLKVTALNYRQTKQQIPLQQMQFNPEKDIFFPYQSNKHLSSQLTIKNTTSTAYTFKFKASNPKKMLIKPSTYCLKPNEQVVVKLAVHKEIVPHLSSERIQIAYGNKDYSQSKKFNLLLDFDSNNARLNLTCMVRQKEKRVRNLENDLITYKFMTPKPWQSQIKGRNNVIYVTVLIIGILLGYFSPLYVFHHDQ